MWLRKNTQPDVSGKSTLFRKSADNGAVSGLPLYVVIARHLALIK